jgi:hypothetical protein
MRMRGRGRIINISSVNGQFPIPTMGVYSAAKHAVEAETTALRDELKPYGIKVSLIQPGMMPTEGIGKMQFPPSINDPSNPYRKAENSGRELSFWGAKQTGATPDSVAKSIVRNLRKSNPPLRTQPSLDSWSMLLGKRLLPDWAIHWVVSHNLPNYANWGQMDPPRVPPGKTTGPIAAPLQISGFSMGFLGDMNARAKEITAHPEAVEERLKAAGVHEPYVPPKHHTNVKFRGRLVVKGSMADFFELWNSWIKNGYGSINDRQYADLILKYRDWVKSVPAMASLPMESEDVFYGEVVDGKMVLMSEKTTSKFARTIPSSIVNWVYRRQHEPTSSNSFEKKIDDFDGDLTKVQAFYNNVFSAKQVDPKMTAEVKFEVEPVDELPETPEQSGDFTHEVKLPFTLPVPRGLTGSAPALKPPAGTR